MKDPLPALVAALELVEVTHANDRLAVNAIGRAIIDLSRGAQFSAEATLVSARGTMRDLGRHDAAMVLALAIEELRK